MAEGWFIERDQDNGYNWQSGDNISVPKFSELKAEVDMKMFYLYHTQAQVSNAKEGGITLSTPWLNFSLGTSNYFIEFKNYLKTDPNLEHFVMIRSFASQNWVIIDTLHQTNDWENLSLNITHQVDAYTDKRCQIGFRTVNNNTALAAFDLGWAIDNITIKEVPNGYLDVYVTSPLNAPLFNAKVSIPELNLEFFTGIDGHAHSGNALFDGQQFDIVISANDYKTDDSTGVARTVTAFETSTLNTDLKRKLPTPQNLSINYTQEGFAVLNWDAAETAGLLANDSEHFYTFYKQKNAQAVRFELGNYDRILFNKIKICAQANTAPDSLLNISVVKIVPADANGLPDTDNPYYVGTNLSFKQSAFTFNSSVYPQQAAWYTFNLGLSKFIIDQPVFFIVFEDATKSIDFAIDNSSTIPVSYRFTNNAWSKDEYAVKVRAVHDVGIGLDETFAVQRSLNDTPFEPLIGKTQFMSYVDSTVTFGANAKYVVAQYIEELAFASATDTTGEFSNQVDYIANEAPWINLPYPMHVEWFEHTNAQIVDSFPIINTGTHPLNYSLSYAQNFIPDFAEQATSYFVLQEDIHWAKLYVIDPPITPGESANVNFYIKNQNNDMDADWVQKIIMHFPKGISVDSTGNFTQFGSDLHLYSNQSTGNGATVQWSDPNLNEWGEIQSRQIGLTGVKLTRDANFTEDFYIKYEIFGHQGGYVIDSIAFYDLPYDLNFTQNQMGSIAPMGGVQYVKYQIDLNTRRTGLYPGYVMFMSNAINEPVTFRPFHIFVERLKGTVSGVVTNAKLPEQHLANQQIVLIDTLNQRFRFYGATDTNGAFEFDSVPQGTYYLHVKNPDYLPYKSLVSITQQGQTEVRNPALVPFLEVPQNALATASASTIAVSWDKPVYTEAMEGYVGDAIGNQWTVIDADADGNEFIYSNHAQNGVTSAAIRRNRYKNNDWLISPAMQVTATSVLQFYAGNTNDPQRFGEHFTVKVSISNNTTASFTETILDYTFTEAGKWVEFNLPLAAYAGQATVHIAFNSTSEDKAYLFIDNIRITDLVSIPANTQNAVLQQYAVFRSEDNTQFANIGTVATESFTDNTATPDTEYFYKTQSQYNIGNAAFTPTVSATIANIAPTINMLLNLQVNEDQETGQRFVITDANGTTPTLSATDSEAVLSFEFIGDSLAIRPQQNWNGTSTVTLTASDGIVESVSSFDVELTAVNDAPAFSSTPNTDALVNLEYRFSFLATDADADVLTYTATVLPSWLTFNTDTKLLSGIPAMTDAGDTTVTITVSDAIAEPVVLTFGIFVEYVNQQPQFTTQPILSVNELVTYSYTIAVTDTENDALTYTLVTKPEWLNWDEASLTFSGIPQNADVGLHNVEILVADGITEAVSQKFFIDVIDINQLPVWVSETVYKVTENVQYNYYANANDPDDDPLTYTVITKPDWLTYIENDKLFTGTPQSSDIGEHVLSISVTDGVGEPVINEFTIKVTNQNLQPVVTSVPITTAESGVPYYYIVVVNDEAPDSLVFTAQTKPKWMSLVHEPGDNYAILQGIPSATDTDTLVHILISDKVNEPTSHMFPVLINFTAANELESGDIRLYPNPTNGRFAIELPTEHTGSFAVTVYALSGQNVYFSKITDSNRHIINVHNWQPATYLVLVKTNDKHFIKKLIIEK